MIDVSCALIVDNDLILVAQRSTSMRLPLKWEFPGGKIEQGETAEVCLVREILEELSITVEIIKPLLPSISDDGRQVIRLFPFLCRIVAGEISLNEHANYRWLLPNELADLDWAVADLPIVEAYLLKLF